MDGSSIHLTQAGQKGLISMLSFRSLSFSLTITLLLIGLSTVVSSCGSRGSGHVSYQPTFIPLKIIVNSNGDVTVDASTDIVTPIGIFGIGAGVELNPDEDSINVIVQDRNKGTETVYKVKTKGTPFVATYDGVTTLRVTSDKIVIDVTERRNSEIAVRPMKPTESSAPTAPPPPTPIQTPTDVPIPTSPPLPTPSPAPTPLSCQWYIQAYNATDPSDVNEVLVNGAVVAQIPDKDGFMQDTSWIDISSELKDLPANVVRFRANSLSGSATWGFRLRLGDNTVIDEHSNGGSGGGEQETVFDRSYTLRNDCTFSPIMPTGDQWTVEIESHDWTSGKIILDGAAVWEYRDQTYAESAHSYDFSSRILQGQSHVITFQCSDLAPLNGSGTIVYSIHKNGQTVFSRPFTEGSRSFSEGGGGCQAFNLFLSPEGRLTLEAP